MISSVRGTAVHVDADAVVVEVGGVGLHVAVTLAFFVLVLRFGPQLFAAVSRAKFNLMRRGSQLGYLLAFLLVMSLLAMTLGVNVMLPVQKPGPSRAPTAFEPLDSMSVTS